MTSNTLNDCMVHRFENDNDVSILADFFVFQLRVGVTAVENNVREGTRSHVVESTWLICSDLENFNFYASKMDNNSNIVSLLHHTLWFELIVASFSHRISIPYDSLFG